MNERVPCENEALSKNASLMMQPAYSSPPRDRTGDEDQAWRRFCSGGGGAERTMVGCARVPGVNGPLGNLPRGDWRQKGSSGGERLQRRAGCRQRRERTGVTESARGVGTGSGPWGHLHFIPSTSERQW